MCLRFSPLVLGENNLINYANSQITMMTSACQLKSISTLVLHTHFNILSWILGTSVYIYILFGLFPLELFTSVICLEE